MRLFVGNLSVQTTEQTLSELFARHGTVRNLSIVIDRTTGRSRGFAFVEMSTDDESKAAMTTVNGSEFEGRVLRVDEARAPSPGR